MTNEASAIQPESTFGQYKIIGLLGHGGMGAVYEALHGILGTKHALKILNSNVMEHTGALERFRREGRAMAGLTHPNVVSVDDFGETDGRHWLRMELMKGREVNGKVMVSLDEYVTAHGGRLPEAEVTTLMEGILAGLGHAHEKGLIHRDLKPANVLFQGNRVKIADFGLVNAVGADWMETQVRDSIVAHDEQDTLVDSGGTGSQSRAIMGTYAFMSPEQRQGMPVDHRSDLYAIGLMAFRMLTGKERLGFKPPSQMVDGISKNWDGWLEKALEEEKEKRFSTAKQMLEALEFPPELTSQTQTASSTQPAAYVDVQTNPETAKAWRPAPQTPTKPKVAPQPVSSRTVVRPQKSSPPPSPSIQKFMPWIIAGACVAVGILFWILFFGKKAPRDPEEMAKAVLETIIDEDFDAFMGMTVATLSVSQWESVMEDWMERNIDFQKKELAEADRDEERMQENRIERLEKEMKHLEVTALQLYLRNTLDELDYDDWESVAEDLRKASIEAIKEEIDEADREEREYLEEALDELEDKDFRKSEYNDWDDARERRKERWEDAFDDAYEDGEDDVDWDEAEFKKIVYDEDQREAVNDFDIEIHLTYRKDTYILELNDCIETNLGILMTDTPRWIGEKTSSSRYEKIPARTY